MAKIKAMPRAEFGFVIFMMVIVLLSCVIYITGIGQVEDIPEAQYSIYQYDYNETIVYRYKHHKLIYEYSYNGLHLVSLIDDIEQISIVTFPDQDKAKEFCYSYLYDIQMEDQLK